MGTEFNLHYKINHHYNCHTTMKKKITFSFYLSGWWLDVVSIIRHQGSSLRHTDHSRRKVPDSSPRLQFCGRYPWILSSSCHHVFSNARTSVSTGPILTICERLLALLKYCAICDIRDQLCVLLLKGPKGDV